ncbi:putative 4-hydroxybenzoyl CoA thioesterase [Azorhizobium caulinodans ORS 571]|uniref:Putative 4-hydroxybenzoyl CoA thioesterase n=1 Tax=Azorhizobium caulinodans (strain ATCC 43989 / DSM 5975 / JCM 20966 / LMG 6465 / NBRC 14845 / NCIMB 13405 / ORS 571) TaxID=438753 RepID=A8ICB4_AZOC5|nr:thioesterase family protein [Azorhizobium caulinodans]BAF89184.1 putative 4-hydroxybenzoyl CoA thioesterase [Azorhizobium caulinodans ORS 571]
MAFETSRLLGFGDCDPAGIAFFPGYMRLLVSVTEEMFAASGTPWPAMIRERRIGVPTVKLDVDFVAPAFHGDELDFRVSIARLGGSSADLRHRVAVGERTVWTARQVLVATSLESHRAIRWPDDVRAGLAAHLETNDARDPAA